MGWPGWPVTDEPVEERLELHERCRRRLRTFRWSRTLGALRLAGLVRWGTVVLADGKRALQRARERHGSRVLTHVSYSRYQINYLIPGQAPSCLPYTMIKSWPGVLSYQDSASPAKRLYVDRLVQRRSRLLPTPFEPHFAQPA